MHETASDRMSRSQQAEIAAGIHRGETLRSENGVIRLLLDRFEAAETATDVTELPRLRGDFKSSQIAAAAMAPGMAPGSDRRWIFAFVQLAGVWWDMSLPADERAAAGEACRLMAQTIRKMRRV